jgi:hypothetical protein
MNNDGPDDGQTLEVSFLSDDDGEVSCSACSSVFTKPPRQLLEQHARDHVRDQAHEVQCDACGHVKGLTYNRHGRERMTLENGVGWQMEVPVVLVCRNPDCPTNESDMAKATGPDGADS